MYYLGVDGGGTKTAFMLIDQNGQIMATASKDTLYYMKNGINHVIETLNSGIKEILEQAGIHLFDIEATCIGLPGLGEIKEDCEVLERAILENVPLKAVSMYNDVNLGWAGSLCCNPGINIVAGTGSIAFGADIYGNTARTGGWGYQIDGDEGSAHWIGFKLIQTFTKQSDGRIERTLLYNYLKRMLNIEDDFDILNLIIHKMNLDRTEIAQFSKFAYDLALQGDPPALRIFEDAAFELHLMVKALSNRLDFGEKTIKVSYSGGVFNSGDIILRPLSEYLSSLNVHLVEPVFSPSIGACLLAYKNINKQIDQQLIERLKEQTSHGDSRLCV